MFRRLFVFTAVALLSLRSPLIAQTPQEVRRAFADLRSDDKPRNCADAMLWLDKHREKLRSELLGELYKTDRQGRDAIMAVLFHDPSFEPDLRFARFVMARLPEEDGYVHNLDIDTGFGETFETRGGPESGGAAHWAAWKFIDAHYDLFEPLLIEAISKSDDMLSVWATTWLMKKRGVLSAHIELFTPKVLARVAANLRDDKTGYNAGQAVRIFLLIGDRALPVLRQAAQSDDAQAKSLGRALTDAIANGERKAFGFLSTKSNLTLTPFGPRPKDPEWLAEVVVDEY